MKRRAIILIAIAFAIALVMSIWGTAWFALTLFDDPNDLLTRQGGLKPEPGRTQQRAIEEARRAFYKATIRDTAVAE